MTKLSAEATSSLSIVIESHLSNILDALYTIFLSPDDIQEKNDRDKLFSLLVNLLKQPTQFKDQISCCRLLRCSILYLKQQHKNCNEGWVTDKHVIQAIERLADMVCALEELAWSNLADQAKRFYIEYIQFCLQQRISVPEVEPFYNLAFSPDQNMSIPQNKPMKWYKQNNLENFLRDKTIVFTSGKYCNCPCRIDIINSRKYCNCPCKIDRINSRKYCNCPCKIDRINSRNTQCLFENNTIRFISNSIPLIWK